MDGVPLDQKQMKFYRIVQKYLIVCASNYHPGGYISGNMGRLLLPQQYHQSTLLGVQNYQLRDSKHI